jgi:hypothetical protein
MARTYRECPACGKRALSIATRCPGCGHELLTQAVQRPAGSGSRRLGPPLALAALLLGAGGLLIRLVHRHEAPGPEATATADLAVDASVALDTARAASSPVLPDSAPSAEAVPLVARTWTKVHDRRSTRADLVAVLLPGDTVLADSLRGGWWRVALEGRLLGYVYAPTLSGN